MYGTRYVVAVVFDADDVVVRRRRDERVAVVEAAQRLGVCRDAHVLTDDVDVQIAEPRFTRVH